MIADITEAMIGFYEACNVGGAQGDWGALGCFFSGAEIIVVK